LTIEQIGSLMVEQIPNISEYAIANMFASQLAAFDVTQLTSFNSNQKAILSLPANSGKLSLMSAEQRQALGVA
jgi:hypothetical protein